MSFITMLILPIANGCRWQKLKKPLSRLHLLPKKDLAPQVGLEPTTLRLTAECSAIELLRSKGNV
jgi:hypothetical protein